MGYAIAALYFYPVWSRLSFPASPCDSRRSHYLSEPGARAADARHRAVEPEYPPIHHLASGTAEGLVWTAGSKRSGVDYAIELCVLAVDQGRDRALDLAELHLPDRAVHWGWVVSLVDRAVLAFENLMTRAFIGKPEDVERDRVTREVTQRIAIENHPILLQLQRMAGEYKAQDFWTDGFSARWSDDFASKVAHDPAAQQLMRDYIYRIGVNDRVRGLPLQKPEIDSYCRGYREGQDLIQRITDLALA